MTPAGPGTPSSASLTCVWTLPRRAIDRRTAGKRRFGHPSQMMGNVEALHSLQPCRARGMTDTRRFSVFRSSFFNRRGKSHVRQKPTNSTARQPNALALAAPATISAGAVPATTPSRSAKVHRQPALRRTMQRKSTGVQPVRAMTARMANTPSRHVFKRSSCPWSPANRRFSQESFGCVGAERQHARIVTRRFFPEDIVHGVTICV